MKQTAALALAGLVAAGLPACSSKAASPNAPAISAPVASFTYSPADPTIGQTVQFTDTSTHSPTSWSWAFGDGATSSAQSPSHAYASAGTFIVTLVASNARGSGPSANAVAVAAVDARPKILLGRATDSSITASVMGEVGTEVYLEYGTSSGSYAGTSATATISSSAPAVVTMAGLQQNTKHYYRARYRLKGESTYRGDVEHTFQTKRMSGCTFTFVIQADPHLDYNSSTAVYTQTLLNELADEPDFLIDLGDASMVDKCAIDGATLCATPNPVSASTVAARNALIRSYYEIAAHSVPLLMVLGNHDGESARDSTLDGWAISARKTFFVNPEPDAFYSGDSEAWPGFGLRQNYYAFEWGDALFVVLDPYPYSVPKGQDGWGWTLGATQCQWLARTLATSRARFKFVFSHHLVGGNGTDARGGAAFAQYFEWGGRNLDGSWGFDAQRPGWSAPIHQLFLDNGVAAWFHGHDHFYAREEVDGVIYQEVPQPSLALYDVPDPGHGYGYVGTNGVNIFPSSGHLRVRVGPSEVLVEYVKSVAPGDETETRKNRTVVTSYVMK